MFRKLTKNAVILIKSFINIEDDHLCVFFEDTNTIIYNLVAYILNVIVCCYV